MDPDGISSNFEPPPKPHNMLETENSYAQKHNFILP